jgi:hypothetical protein
MVNVGIDQPAHAGVKPIQIGLAFCPYDFDRG